MKALLVSDIHGDIAKLSRVLRVAADLSDFSIVIVPGDFGDLQTIRFLGRWCERNGVLGIGVYGNNEERGVLGVVKYGSFRVLRFGEVADLPGLGRCLGVPGVYGVSKWYHWREEEVLELRSREADCILSHEMPFGLADECAPGVRCGKMAIRLLVEAVCPRIFIGGHLHGPPRRVMFGPTLVVKGGSLFGDSSWFTILDLDSLEAVDYSCTHGCGVEGSQPAW